MTAIGPSRHIAPPRELGRFRVKADNQWQARPADSVAHDPSVWTGRALQAESSEWVVWSCASVSGPCVELIAPGHHGYPRAFDLILGSRIGLEGQLGHQITNATARPFSILQIQLADLGGYLIQCAL